MVFLRKKEEKIVRGPVIWEAGKTTLEVPPEKPVSPCLLGIPVSPEAIPGQGQIIAVQCVTPGDGATTVAANMSALLAMSSPEKVVLIDLDGYGSVRSRLGLPVEEYLANIAEWEYVQNPRETASQLVAHSTGIMVVPGVVHLDDVTRVTPQLVFKMLAILKEQFDYIIADCPPVGVNNNTWAAALVADRIVTVMRPARTSLDLLRENNKFLDRLGCRQRVRVVLNQAGLPGGIKPGDLVDSGEPDFNIGSVLPYSTGVEESNNRRELVVLVKRREHFSCALQRLVYSIQGGG